MRKTIAILGGLVMSVGSMAFECPVEQRDWPEYFPDIAAHASVYEPEFDAFDTNYVTPHTPWGKPYHAGKIKALVVMPRVSMRDAVELAQRLEMEVETLATFSRQTLGGSDAGRYELPVGFTEAERVSMLREMLEKPRDVLIIGKINWEAFPCDLQSRILAKVKDGMGLILAFDRGDETYIPPEIRSLPANAASAGSVAQGIPFTALDAWKACKTDEEAAGKTLDCKAYGKGRVAIIKTGGFLAHTCFVPCVEKPEVKLWPVDYYFSLAARAVAWAAGKEPLGVLQCSLTGRTLSVSFNGGHGNTEFELKVRDDWGEVVHSVKGRGTSFELPELAAGPHMADVIVSESGRVLNWGSMAFQAAGEPIIKSLDAEPRVAKPSEPVNLKLSLSGKHGGPLVLLFKAWDMRQRLLCDAKQEVKAGEEQITVPLRLARPLTNLIRVRVWLMSDGKELGHAETWIPVNLPFPRDDFGFVCWYLSMTDYVSHYLRNEMVKLGVDSSYGGRSQLEAWIPATVGIHCIPYMTRYAIDKTSSGPYPERVPCLSDPGYIAKEQEKLKKSVGAMSVFGAAGYSLGDENDLSLNNFEICFSPSCKAAFREYMKSVYGSLDALNKEWDTAFASWAEVEPMPLPEAKEKKQPACWVDFRMSMENVFLNIHKTGAATVKSVDPAALVGFDGGFNITSFTGYDWWKLSRIMEVWGVYPDHLQSEILRSFHLPEARTGRWYGGYYNITRFVEYARWEPWYDLFHEMNNVWWFNLIGGDSGGCQAEDTFNPATMKPFPILKAASDETMAIKSGIGKLLMGCRRDSGGIAILYSQASLHAATYHGMRHNPCDSQLDFIKALEDLSCQYRFVSYEQLKDGVLEKEKYRFLILPCAVALSNGERERIKAFVAVGGKVMADDKAGVYDEHGKAVADSQWTTWFDGHATRIGAMLRGYKREVHFAASARKEFKAKLTALGMAPEFSLAPDGGGVYEGELAVFTDGDAKYVGLLRDHSPKRKEQSCAITFPGKFHIYDIRKGGYEGFDDHVHTDLEPGTAGLWALLPSRPSQFRLDMAKTAKLGETVDISIETDSLRRCVVRVEVVDPDDATRRHYCLNLTTVGGKAKGSIPFALNDPKGRWTVRAKDVVSGMSATEKIDLR